MKRFAIGLICICTIYARAFSQSRPKQDPSEAAIADTIAKVRNISASKLDKRLPHARLQDWLQTQTGSRGRIAWAYQYASDGSDPRACVQAVLTLNKDQSFLVSIDGQDLSFESGWVILGKQQSINLTRLSDLPNALSKLRDAE